MPFFSVDAHHFSSPDDRRRGAPGNKPIRFFAEAELLRWLLSARTMLFTHHRGCFCDCSWILLLRHSPTPTVKLLRDKR